jgi:hypothetical protein
MSQEQMHRLYEAKVGPAVLEGATVDNTVRTNAAALPPGWNVIESTQDIRFLQTTAAVAAAPPTAGDLLTLGRRLPKNTELHFFVADDRRDAYLVWTRVSADGTVSIYKSDEIYEGP